MRKLPTTVTRGLATCGVLLPLLLSAACGSGSGSGSTNAAANNAGAAQPAAAASNNGAAMTSPDTSGADANGGAGGQAMSVTITEKVGPPDHYAFSPSKVTVPMGQGLSIVNKSDEEHVLSCTPSPGVSADMLTVEKAATQTVTFAKAGTYKCVSKTHKTAKITITVS